VIEAEKLADIEAEAKRTVEIRGDSWSPTYVKNRAAETLELVEEIRRLQELAKEAPFLLGDVVREVGEEEPTGKIVLIKESRHDTGYVVKLFRPNGFTGNITYYHDEIELIERPK
jgi:hypothetical protein